MVQILQDFETLGNDVMSSVALDMCDEADTTGVMFVGGVVKALLQGKIHLVFPRHNTRRHLSIRLPDLQTAGNLPSDP
jgi:hypothetical protein